MVERGEGDVWAPDFAPGVLQFFEGVWRMKLMGDVAVDEEKVAPVHALTHNMGVPDLVEY